MERLCLTVSTPVLQANGLEAEGEKNEEKNGNKFDNLFNARQPGSSRLDTDVQR